MQPPFTQKDVRGNEGAGQGHGADNDLVAPDARMASAAGQLSSAQLEQDTEPALSPVKPNDSGPASSPVKPKPKRKGPKAAAEVCELVSATDAG